MSRLLTSLLSLSLFAFCVALVFITAGCESSGMVKSRGFAGDATADAAFVSPAAPPMAVEHAAGAEAVQDPPAEEEGSFREDLRSGVLTAASIDDLADFSFINEALGDTADRQSDDPFTAFARALRQAGLDPANPTIRRAVILTRQLIGFPRHLSQHVGGFVLTRDRLTETVPIGNAAMAERSFIEWDKDDIAALGLMKVDVLALGMLSCVRKCFDLIVRHAGGTLTLASVPDEDPATYAMLSRADSLGVFQVESRAQMNMLPRMRPTTFYDLVIEVAIVRPGPIQGDMVHPYLRRRQGREAVSYPSPAPGARTSCAASSGVPSACRCSRNRRCRSPSTPRASRRRRRTACAAPWPPSARSAPSSIIRRRWSAA